MSNGSIWLIDRTLSGSTTPRQSEPESDDNEGVHHILQSSSIIGNLPSDCLVSYLGHWLGGVSFSSAEMHFVYSANWAIYILKSPSHNPDVIWLSTASKLYN